MSFIEKHMTEQRTIMFKTISISLFLSLCFCEISYSQSLTKSVGININRKKYTDYIPLIFTDSSDSKKISEIKEGIELNCGLNYMKIYEYGLGISVYKSGEISALFTNKIIITPFLIKKPSRFDFFIPFSIEWYYNRQSHSVFKKDFHIKNVSIGIGSRIALTHKISAQLILYKDLSPFINVYTHPYLQFGISYNWGKIKDE